MSILNNLNLCSIARTDRTQLHFSVMAAKCGQPPVNDDEIWAPATTDRGLQPGYQVSTHGRVFSRHKKTEHGIMKANATNHGYLKLNINKVFTTVAKLVLYTFDRPPVDKEQAIFIDKNKNNVRLDNLQWASKNPARVPGVSTSARPVVVADDSGQEIEFSSPGGAAVYLGISRDTVYKKLKDGKATRTGYFVKYLAMHDATTESRSLDSITDSTGGLAYTDGSIKTPSGGSILNKAPNRDPSNPAQVPYLRVHITSSAGEEHGKAYYIHDLISGAFLGPKPENMVVNHKNGNTWDNSVHNLEYLSQGGNSQHACDTGLRLPPGEKKVLQFSYDTVHQLYTLVKEYRSISEAARQLQCSDGTIAKRCKLHEAQLPKSLQDARKPVFQKFVFRYEDDDRSGGPESKKQRVL